MSGGGAVFLERPFEDAHGFGVGHEIAVILDFKALGGCAKDESVPFKV